MTGPTGNQVALLGRFTDREVGERTGCSRNSVQTKRSQLRIAAYGDARRGWQVVNKVGQK